MKSYKGNKLKTDYYTRRAAKDKRSHHFSVNGCVINLQIFGAFVFYIIGELVLSLRDKVGVKTLK